MIRKWPYININFKKNRFFSINHSFLKKHLFFKVFKKNTRFKKYNITLNTFFIRKFLMKKKRCTNLSVYVTMSYFWVKFFLKNKKLVNFLHFKQIYRHLSTYTNSNIFNYKYKSTLVLGIGLYSTNFTIIKPSLVKNITNSLLQNSFYKKFNSLINISYFNSLSTFSKLNSLGYAFKTKIQVNKNKKIITFPNIVTKILLHKNISIKLIHTYIVLLKII